MAAKIVEEFRKTQQVGQSCLINSAVKISLNVSKGKYKLRDNKTKAPFKHHRRFHCALL